MVKKGKVMPPDFGSPELARQFTVVPLFSGAGVMAGKVMDETEIDRLLLKDTITSAQHATLTAFTGKLHKAGFLGMKSPQYDAPISLDPSAVATKKANLIRYVVKVFKELDKKIGPTKRRALVDMCIADIPWRGDGLHETISELETILRA